MAALTDAEIRAALPSESRQKIDSAFEALSQSMPTDKERMILYRVAHTLKLNPTDTHFSVMAALHYYLQLYQMIPDRINTTARETLQKFKGAAEAQAIASAEQVKAELVKAVVAATTEVAAATSRKQMWQWASVCLTVAFLGVGLFGWLMHSTGQEAGYQKGHGAGYAESKDEKAAASWANTPEGQLAFQLAEAGSITALATCDVNRGWELEKNICHPQNMKNGIYGWKVKK